MTVEKGHVNPNPDFTVDDKFRTKVLWRAWQAVLTVLISFQIFSFSVTVHNTYIPHIRSIVHAGILANPYSVMTHHLKS